MENLYGLPVIHDQEALSIVPAWSLQLARVLAARDAAIVAATGAVPEGNPNTTAGLATRMALAEATIDALDPDPWVTLELTNGWTGHVNASGYLPGLRARVTPLGLQIQGMIGKGQTGTIANLPANMRPEYSQMFSAPAYGGVAVHYSVSRAGDVRYEQGPSAPQWVGINALIPMTSEALDPALPELPAHEHVIADVTGLQAALDGKLSATGPRLAFDTDDVPYIAGGAL